MNLADFWEARVALPVLYECAPAPAGTPSSTIRYSSRDRFAGSYLLKSLARPFLAALAIEPQLHGAVGLHLVPPNAENLRDSSSRYIQRLGHQPHLQRKRRTLLRRDTATSSGAFLTAGISARAPLDERQLSGRKTNGLAWLKKSLSARDQCLVDRGRGARTSQLANVGR